MSTSAPHRFRVLWLACLALLAATLPLACRGPAAGPPDGARRTPIEKPWTKEAIESHTYLWLELSTGKRGVMTGPVLASDASGEYLTTRKDPNVHLPLADVVVMDAVDLTTRSDATPADATATSADPGGSTATASDAPGHEEETPVVQSAGASLLAFWGGLIFFVPTILLILLIA